jgi:hypothetical protein
LGSVIFEPILAICADGTVPLPLFALKVTLAVGVLTVTVQVAVLPPSAVLTVIVALPAATALTTPLDDTVATEVALLLHVTALFVALEGETVAIKISVPPTVRLVDALFKVTLVTETGETVMEHAAVLLLSTVVTVITALPTATPTTTPFVTVAMLELLLDHITFWLVALEGVTVAVSVSKPPTVMLAELLFRDTLVTGTTTALTVTAQVAVLLPSAVVTVIVAFPAATPVIIPVDETVATPVLLLLHVTL